LTAPGDDRLRLRVDCPRVSAFDHVSLVSRGRDFLPLNPIRKTDGVPGTKTITSNPKWKDDHEELRSTQP
jgi:hypothetical protein